MQEHAGGALTQQQDLYLAVVVTVLFLAGCAIAIANRYRRTRERQRWNSNSGVAICSGNIPVTYSRQQGAFWRVKSVH